MWQLSNCQSVHFCIMRHLSVDYLSASSLSDCYSSLYTTICLNTAPQTKYLNTTPDTLAPWRCIQSTAIRWLKRFRNLYSFCIFRANFEPIFARSASAITPSEKSSVNTNRKSTMRFPLSLRWPSYVASKPPKWGLKNAKRPMSI